MGIHFHGDGLAPWNVANLAGVAAGVVSSDVGLYHTRGAVGNGGYFDGYLRREVGAIG
jgi:hypothetical protein